jgi:tRNA(fMet)-specific endonuclease VapC
VNFYLDTNICIYLLTGKLPGLTEKLLTYDPNEIKIPSIVAAELFYGVYKSQKQKDSHNKIEHFLQPFQIARFDYESADIYGKIRADLERIGKLIGPNDLMIAAVVLANNGILVTQNTREFMHVENLVIQDWTKN